jgi:hypothetical protein
MPGTGIEPVQCEAPRDFKSLASTNSATQARLILCSFLTCVKTNLAIDGN